MTERGRKLGTHLESIHSYVVKDCSSIEESQDNCLSEELADEIRKRTTSVDSEIKQLENQMGQLQRTLVKGKARRESIRHRLSASSSARKLSSMSSSCSSLPEDEALTAEDYKSKIEMLENEKLELLEDKKDLNDEIKFLKYQLQYRLEVQSLQNERDGKTETHIKLENENKTLREENTKLKDRFSTLKKKLEESGQIEEALLTITDVPDGADSSALIESELDRMYTERKILLSTIMRMQSMEKDEDEEVSFADFGVQCNLMKMESTEEKNVTPLVAKLTKENKALKKHITDMQNEIDEREEESKALDEENYKLTEEKRSLEDTINKLRTQINETLDTTLDEIEHLHSFNEDLEVKFKRTEAKNREISQALTDLQNRNCKSLENLLDQVENKSTIEDVFDYLDREIGKLIEENCSIPVQGDEQKDVQEKKEEKQFTSNLLSEVKNCKDLLESQRSHIRNLQLEKRDIEEGYTKMKRELFLLKSNKQRARESSKELEFLKKRRVKSLNDGTLGGIETKTVLVDKESLQREVKRLGAVKTQLENNVQKLKKEKTTLEDEKVCLLGSLYHQLERNESLEIQVEELTIALEQWEAKADLENEVFERKSDEKAKEVQEEETVEDDYQTTIQHSLDVVDITCEDNEPPRTFDEESIVTSTSEGHVERKIETSSNESLDTEADTENLRPSSPVVSVVSSAAEESLQELKQKIHALGEQLQNVQASVCELESERDKLQEDLEESKKNEKELRNVIIQLKRENELHLDKLAKSNDLAEMLQVRLREAKEAQEEAMESLEEANEEKYVCKRHSEVLDKRLQEVAKQRDDAKNEVDLLSEKAKNYKQNLREILVIIKNVDSYEEESSDETEECEKDEGETQKESIAGLKRVKNKVNEMKRKLEEKCVEYDVLKNQLTTLNTEKEVLQKSVREIDDKKKQMKGFITKLTEEKEKVTEQLDEMKQQKSNLADALENVYQSKEKLQNRFGEALCKQEQYKKSLTEALDEVKTLKESLCRVVNEHETMKESLLAANREVERLKSEQQVHIKKTELDVIPEEEEKNREENLAIVKDNSHEDVFHSDADSNNNKEDLKKAIDSLKKYLALLSEEESTFETRITHLLRRKERDVDELQNSHEERKDDDPQASRDKKSNKIFDSSETENIAIQTEHEDEMSMQLSAGSEIILETEKHATHIEAIIEQATSQLQYFANKIQDQDTVDSERQDVEKEKEQLMEWFEVISNEKENLEKELETVSKDNIELVQALEKMRKEKEGTKCQLLRALKSAECDVGKEKGTGPATEEMKLNTGMNEKEEQEKELKDGSVTDDICELINKLEMLVETKDDLLNAKNLEKAELLKLTREFQEENESLNEKSIKETQALEKQVELLSKEGATLRGEADERVQRLIELEEKMIVTMEKKLELAEYAKSLKSKKDSLDKKCEELSREVQGLQISRGQLLAGKGEVDEKLRAELKMLKVHKDKSIKEIEELGEKLKDVQQNFEAIKIELDSMQRKNKALKQDREKCMLKEAELSKKNSELEQSVSKIAKQVHESSEENKELNKLLNKLIIVFDKEITGKESTSPECENMEIMKKKVGELQEWIRNVNEELQSQTNETTFLKSFVQEINVKISEVLENEGCSPGLEEEGEEECEIPQNKENHDNIKYKLELLIEKLREGFRNKTEFAKIREEELTMRNSFERNVVTQKAGDSVKVEGEKQETSEQDGKFCDNCKKLEKEYDDLNTKFLSMNEESSELMGKCHRLKEQLILLKQQKGSNEKDEISDQNTDLLDSCEFEVVPQNADDYQCELHTVLDMEDGLEESTEILKKQLQRSIKEKAELEDKLKSMENNVKETMHQHQREAAELKKEIKQLESELNESKKEKTKIEALVFSLRGELQSKHQQETKMQTSVSDRDKDGHSELHKTLVEKSNSVKDLNEKLGVSKNFMQKILDENTDLKENVVILEKEAKDMMNETEVLKAELDLKKRALVQAKEETSIIESKNHQLEEEIASLKEQLRIRRNLLATLEKDKESFKVSLREAQNEITSMKKKDNELKDLLSSGKQRRLETENLIKKLKQSCDEMTAKFEKASTEKTTNEELLQNEKAKTDELKAKLEKLEKENEGLKSICDKCKEQVEHLTAELRKDKARRDREVGNIKQENAKLLADEGRADRECDSLRQQLDEERKKTERLAEDCKELNKENEYLKKNLQLESDEKIKTTKEGRRLSTLTGDLKAKLANLEAIITAIKKENKDFKEELDRTKEHDGDLRLRLSEANEDKEELEKIIDELREKRQKLYNEIDKALAERDDFEDDLIDTKQQMTKEMESLVKQKIKTNEKLQHLENVEIGLKKELEEHEKTKAAISQENLNLKDELEKIKNEVGKIKGRSEMSTEPGTPISIQDKEDYIRKLKEGQYEIKKLTCALEKSKKEMKKWKTEYQKLKEVEREPDNPIEADVILQENIVVQEGVMSLESCAVSDVDEPLKEQLSKYMIENMRLRAQLEESDCKLITLQDDLYKISKEGVLGDLRMETLQRECQTLRQVVQKYEQEEESIKRVLRESNNAQADLRKHLRNAITDKEKYEKEYKKMMHDKGLIEKVTVTSIEVPAVSQIEARLGREYGAKAESLESARKEIFILESQVKDLRARYEINRQLVEQILAEITIELNRATNLLNEFLVDHDEEASEKLEGMKNKEIDPNSKAFQDDGVRKGISDLRLIVDTLEGNIMRIREQKGPIIPCEKDNMMKELSDVRNEKNFLSNKLLYLQDKLNEILEERQVLEDIGADTRKELAALVDCLSSEREEKMSISSEHSEMQAKLQEADRNEKALLSEITRLENECEVLYERNRFLEMKTNGLKTRSDKEELKEVMLASDEMLIECMPTIREEMTNTKKLEATGNEKQMTLESLCKDYKEISIVCGKLESRNKVLEEEKSSMVEEMHVYKKKLDKKNQDLLTEIKNQDQHLKNLQDENKKLLGIRKSLEVQVRHLDSEVMFFKDRAVCSEREKERVEDANRQQQNEIQELYLHRSKDNTVREKLENLFYENTKLKEQKRMLVTRLQSLERDVKSQLMIIRDLENEKGKMDVRLKSVQSEKQQEESHKNHVFELLDKQEEKSREDIDALTKMVDQLTREKDELNKTRRLEEERGVVEKLKEENVTLLKENNLLRRACEKLKENRRESKKVSRSKQSSSFSSFDRSSLSNSQHSFSDKPDRGRDPSFHQYINQQTPPNQRRSSSRESHVTGDTDTTSVCSQECYCSPILSVVNLCPLEIQQPTDLNSSRCPKCNKQKKTSVVISEHYV